MIKERGFGDQVILKYNKRKSFTISCIQIGFNASKDIQEWGGHSKLEFIDIKTNISSILSYPYTGLTRLQKQTNNQTDKHKTTEQNKTKIGSITAGSENVQNWSLFFIESRVLNFGILHHNGKNNNKIKAEDLQAY